MRVLLVEDSVRLQRDLSAALRRTGYAVDVSGDGDDGLWKAQSMDFDAIVLDIMLPKRDGLSVLTELRKTGNAVHVLLLTARDAVAERVRGLQTGADDYLVKPFALEEFLARVDALCRRAYGKKHSPVDVGDLTVDSVSKIVRRSDRPIELTPREFQLLEYLVRRRGEVVSRTEIESHIYDDQVDPMSNVVDSAICNLRKKLAVSPASKPLIHTRRGMGYVLEIAAE